MNCIKCKNDTTVTDSRPAPRNRIRRRRKCLGCGDRFSTYELLAPREDTDRRMTKTITNMVIDRFFKGKTKFTIAEMTALKSITEFGYKVIEEFYKGKI